MFVIIFDLQCVCDYQFEGWFESREDFERQNSSSLISCPRCGSDRIHKILSPVPFHTGGACPAQASSPSTEEAALTPQQAMQFLRSIQDFVEQNFEDVGPKMAEESLKIHYGVCKPRNIRGVATANEEKMLADEGIELLKVPMVRKSSGNKSN